jgi:hypothetical protein
VVDKNSFLSDNVGAARMRGSGRILAIVIFRIRETVIMDARQCKRCKKLFHYAGNPLCHACIKLMDTNFNNVRDYIYDNPGATIDEVCTALEVDKADVHRWLAEGRLILSKGSPISLVCEQCGAPILTGKQCEKCLGKLRNDLKGAANILKPPEPKKPFASREEGKMHIDTRKKGSRN